MEEKTVLRIAYDQKGGVVGYLDVDGESVEALGSMIGVIEMLKQDLLIRCLKARAARGEYGMDIG